jgi:serine/threonine-protein kinase
MGEVYRARDTWLGRDVALKILPDTFARDDERVTRFMRETRILASLSHPNIVAIHDVQWFKCEASVLAKGDQSNIGILPGFIGTPEVLGLILELVEGETLADRFTRGPIPLDEALPLAKQIAQALEAAHEQEIIHGDLKPANIKIAPNGRIKVLDFGLATYPYMAPEQAEGALVDGRADVFSFGAVLYEMVSGSRAFPESSTVRVLTSVLRDEPAPVRAPPVLKEIIRRCLIQQPAHRFQTMNDVRAALEKAVEEPLPDGRGGCC